MDYKTALKAVQTKKVKEGYLIIQLGYDSKILLPHKEGITLLSALSQAEHFDDPYNKIPVIKCFDRSKMSVYMMSSTEYEQIHIAAMLGLTLDEVRQAAEPQPTT